MYLEIVGNHQPRQFPLGGDSKSQSVLRNLPVVNRYPPVCSFVSPEWKATNNQSISEFS